MEKILTNLSGYRVRRETVDGREFLVAPATTIVPGVLNGSKGALYYPPEEIKATANAWDGIPLVVYHPVRNGENVSAKHPGVLASQGVGMLLNTTMNGKLRSEAWFDEESLRRVDTTLAEHIRILPRLLAGKPIELSTGLFTDNEESPGTDPKGRPYDYIARNYRPDHLAVLPDQVGACSVNDGCGIGVNMRHHVENEWSDAARAAALEARRASHAAHVETKKTGDKDALQHASDAEISSDARASIQGHECKFCAPEDAAKFHKDAAESHKAAMEKHVEEGHLDAAKAHRHAMKAHESAGRFAQKDVERGLPTHEMGKVATNAWSNAAREASAKARKAASKAAASTEPVRSGEGDGRQAAQDKLDSATAHREAHKIHKAEGNEQQAKYHKAQAALHQAEGERLQKAYGKDQKKMANNFGGDAAGFGDDDQSSPAAVTKPPAKPKKPPKVQAPLKGSAEAEQHIDQQVRNEGFWKGLAKMLFGVVTNDDQPRHPRDGTYQGKTSVHATKGYNGRDPMPPKGDNKDAAAPAELAGEENADDDDGRQNKKLSHVDGDADFDGKKGDPQAEADSHSPQEMEEYEELTEPGTTHNVWSDEAREAAKAARAATTKTGKNSMHGANAHASSEATDTHSEHDATDAHLDAARSHAMASKMERRQGNDKGADDHMEASVAHTKALQALMKRPTGNKNVSNAAGAASVLNQREKRMKDLLTKELKAVIANCSCDKTKKALIALNEKAEGSNADATGDGSIQAGGEETEDNDDLGKSETGKGLTPQKSVKAKDAMTGNLSLEQQEVYNEGLRTIKAEKSRIIGQLTANAVEPQKAAAVYNKMTLTQLREIAPKVEVVEPVFIGNGGGIDAVIDNSASDADDVLPLPVMNYKEEVKAEA